MTEEARFESLEDDDRPDPGPAALLLAGFDPDALPVVTTFLCKLGAPGHQVLLVTGPMLDGTLGEALSTEAQGEPLPAQALPRVAILSGLSGRQIHALIDGWPETGLWRPLWASTTPANLSFGLRDLLRELLAEQRAFASRSAGPLPPLPQG